MGRIKHAVNSPHAVGWPTRIGKLMINFSALEFEGTLWLIQLTERPELASRIGEMQFAQRVRAVMDQVDGRATGVAWRRGARKAWEESLGLARVRNQVAHNPITFAWSDPAQRGEPDFIGIPSVRGKGSGGKGALLSAASIDHAIDRSAAIAQLLARLRLDWRSLRDNGRAPPARPLDVKSVTLTMRLGAAIRAFRAPIRQRG